MRSALPEPGGCGRVRKPLIALAAASLTACPGMFYPVRDVTFGQLWAGKGMRRL